MELNSEFNLKKGQTIGKKMCKIRIAKPDGSVPLLWDSFFKRKMAFRVCEFIPFVGKLLVFVDIMFIFRINRNCIHDDLAGTIVVEDGAPG